MPQRDRAVRASGPGRSLFGLATSLLPFLALWTLMYLALPVSYLLVLVLAVPAAGFLVRTYIVFHDCTHGSYFSSRRANAGSARSSGSWCSRRSALASRAHRPPRDLG